MIDVMTLGETVMLAVFEWTKTHPSPPRRVFVSPEAKTAVCRHMIVNDGAPFDVYDRTPIAQVYGVDWFVDDTLVGKDFRLAFDEDER